MKREMRVVLHLTVEDLSEEERAEIANNMEVKPEELETLSDYSCHTIASELDCIGSPGANDLIFEGTDTMVKFTKCTVIGASYTGPLED